MLLVPLHKEIAETRAETRGYERGLADRVLLLERFYADTMPGGRRHFDPLTPEQFVPPPL